MLPADDVFLGIWGIEPPKLEAKQQAIAKDGQQLNSFTSRHRLLLLHQTGLAFQEASLTKKHNVTKWLFFISKRGDSGLLPKGGVILKESKCCSCLGRCSGIFMGRAKKNRYLHIYSKKKPWKKQT